jgi:hypothetical protein
VSVSVSVESTLLTITPHLTNEQASQGRACHAGRHEAREHHSVGKLLSVRTEGGGPQEHKGVHGGLKKRLHGPQEGDALICRDTVRGTKDESRAPEATPQYYGEKGNQGGRSDVTDSLRILIEDLALNTPRKRAIEEHPG